MIDQTRLTEDVRIYINNLKSIIKDTDVLKAKISDQQKQIEMLTKENINLKSYIQEQRGINFGNMKNYYSKLYEERKRNLSNLKILQEREQLLMELKKSYTKLQIKTNEMQSKIKEQDNYMKDYTNNINTPKHQTQLATEKQSKFTQTENC